MVSIEDEPGSGWYFALHISLGLTAALLLAMRLMWRVRQAPPVLPGTVPAWQAKAARISHALLYTLLVLMPLTGYLCAAFSGEALKEQFFTANSLIAWLLVAMIAMHIGASLKHLLIDKDTVFRRMWPR